MNAVFEKKLETLLNRYLELDPESNNRLQALRDKHVAIVLDAFKGITIQLHFSEEGIKINTSNLYTPDTIIKGKPISLVHLSFAPHQRKKFFEDDVTIEGNIEIGQKIIGLFDELEIDWEEYLSHWIGDIPAHHIGNLVKKIRNFSNKLNETFAQNINEYIHEEILLSPPKEALEDFFHDVDNLRMDADRLEAKLNHLIQMFEAKKEG